jgi:hypothetical protein
VPEKRRSEIPIGMEKVYRRLERWRKIRRGREPIPKRLWAAAPCSELKVLGGVG